MSREFLVLGLGSNLNALKNLRLALQELRCSKIFEVSEVSRIYESEAQTKDGNPSSPSAGNQNPPYLNAAVKVFLKSSDPQEWLSECQKIEYKIGRKPESARGKWSDREIDLDILFSSNGKIATQNLKVPHPLLFERPFALLPMLELVPDFDDESMLPIWAKERWRSKLPFQTTPSKNFFWPEFVSVLNLTSDSFSDGGRFLNPAALSQQIELQLSQGASVFEIGAESTRPRTDINFLSPKEFDLQLKTSVRSAPELALEFERLRSGLEVLSQIRKVKQSISPFKVSVDCRNPEVISKILESYQVDFINDVSGFRNPRMLEVAGSASCQLISMHSLSVPVRPAEIIDESVDPIEILNSWIQAQIVLFDQHHIAKDRLIFDPGIGFGKSAKQSFYLLENLDRLKTSGNPILVGHSRKSFLQLITDRKSPDRDTESALMTARLKRGFYQFLRVHDVASHRPALALE